MALVLADRVKETTNTTGTGTLTLAGAVSGFQSFAAIGNGNTTYYTIVSGTDWEVGIGTYTLIGTTLSRDTVLASSLAGAKIVVVSGASVFCDYPAGKAMALDANGNASAENIMLGYTDTTSAGGTTVLTASSNYWQKISGTTTQTFTLPNATTLPLGATFVFDNDSTGTVTINDNGSTLVDSMPSGTVDYLFLENNSTAAGSWGKYSWLPASYNFSGTSANFGGATASSVILNPQAGTATAGTAPLKFTSGTNLTTAEAGAFEYDGMVPYFSMAASTRGAIPTEQLVVLNSTYTLTSQTAAQQLFNASTNGAVTLPVGTYQFECLFALTGMSTTAGTYGFALGGTATKTFAFSGFATKSANTLSNTVAANAGFWTAATTVLSASTTNTTGVALVKGTIRVTVAGTVIPQVSLSIASAAIVQAGSYFKISPIGSSTVTTVGNWS